jgi:hypothetical protein
VKYMQILGGVYANTVDIDPSVAAANTDVAKMYLSLAGAPSGFVQPQAGDVLDNAATYAFHTPTEPLAQQQAERLQAVTDRTTALLALGFEWPVGSGLRVDCVDKATEIEGAELASLNPATTYPIPWAHIDGSLFALASAADVSAFFAAAFGYRESIEVVGAQLQAAIVAATTQQALDAVVDSR